MSSLAVLLQPLSEADFAHLVAAWLAGDVGGAPARALALLAAQTGDRQVTEAVLENVYAKLTAAGMLPDRSAAKNLLVPCCSTACTLCSCELEAAEAKSAYALCWDTGLQRVRSERRHCVMLAPRAGRDDVSLLHAVAPAVPPDLSAPAGRLLCLRGMPPSHVLRKPGGAPSRLLRRRSASIAGHNGCWPSSRPTPGALPDLDVS